MLDMIQAMSKEIGDVDVQAVKDLSSLFVCFYEPHLAQGSHMMRNGRLAQASRFGQRAHVLLAFGQHGDDAHAAGVAERAEQFRHVGGGMFVERDWFGRVSVIGHGFITEHMFIYS